MNRAEESDWIVVENTHEPIIEQSLFDKVQEINQKAAQKSKATYGKYDHSAERAASVKAVGNNCIDPNGDWHCAWPNAIVTVVALYDET